MSDSQKLTVGEMRQQLERLSAIEKELAQVDLSFEKKSECIRQATELIQHLSNHFNHPPKLDLSQLQKDGSVKAIEL